MRYYSLPGQNGPRLVARRGSDARDLTSVKAGIESFTDLARAADLAETSIDELAARPFSNAPAVDVDVLETEATVPVSATEVWGAGVTYQMSEEAREAESSMPEMYLEVYEADRPELFFKSTPSRTVGPGQRVGVRADSDWDAPEPELGVVLHRGRIVGYTVGNDVSSRDIEGENPLYLPQAKVYDRSCALGPCVATEPSVQDPHDLEMSLQIDRDGETVFRDETSTAEMARTCQELVDSLKTSNPLPETTVLLTGTSLVPPEETTLRPGDEVTIEIERIGRLHNGVTEV